MSLKIYLQSDVRIQSRCICEAIQSNELIRVEECQMITDSGNRNWRPTHLDPLAARFQQRLPLSHERIDIAARNGPAYPRAGECATDLTVSFTVRDAEINYQSRLKGGFGDITRHRISYSKARL